MEIFHSKCFIIKSLRMLMDFSNMVFLLKFIGAKSHKILSYIHLLSHDPLQLFHFKRYLHCRQQCIPAHELSMVSWLLWILYNESLTLSPHQPWSSLNHVSDKIEAMSGWLPLQKVMMSSIVWGWQGKVLWGICFEKQAPPNNSLPSLFSWFIRSFHLDASSIYSKVRSLNVWAINSAVLLTPSTYLNFRSVTLFSWKTNKPELVWCGLDTRQGIMRGG